MRRLKIILVLLLFNAPVFSNGILETFEVNNQNPFNGNAILNWIGDVGVFEITTAGWPYGSAPDFLESHSLRANSETDINATILTSISSFYDQEIRTRWEVFVSGSSIDLTSSKGFSLILFVDSGDVTAIENGTVNGYRLRLCDPGSAYPDGLYFEKSTGSGWIIIDSLHTGDANINQGWTLAVERDAEGNWTWGYSNGAYNASVALTESVHDNDYSAGSYSGMNWYSIASSAGGFGFDNFKVDPYTPGMWREDAMNNDWHTAENWEDGIVPLASTNVQIANANNSPVISNNAECNNLTILAGASLLVNSNQKITINGNLLLESTMNGEANLIDHGNLEIKGSSLVQKYLAHYNSGSNESHFLSIPVNNHPVENSLRYCYVYPYDETTNNWISLSAGDQLEKGVGYSVYYSGNENYLVQFSGTPNTGDQTIPINASGFSGNSSADNWNLIGNPFPSFIDWDLVDKSNIESAIYIWNPRNLTYSSYVDGVGNNMNNDGVIPPMQAFFVHALTVGNLTIPQTARTNYQNQDYLKTKTAEHKILRIKAGKKDEAIIRIKNESTTGFDKLFDAYKMFSNANGNIQIYSVGGNGEKLSINTIPDCDTSRTIQIGILLESADSVDFEFNVGDFSGMKDIFFTDRITGKNIKLLNDTILKFYCLPGDQNRFMVLLVPLVTTINETICEKPRIWVSDGFIRIKLFHQEPTNTNIRLYDLSGRLQFSGIIKNQNEIYIKKPAKTGIYLVQIISEKELINYKILVNKRR